MAPKVQHKCLCAGAAFRMAPCSPDTDRHIFCFFHDADTTDSVIMKLWRSAKQFIMFTRAPQTKSVTGFASGGAMTKTWYSSSSVLNTYLHIRSGSLCFVYLWFLNQNSLGITNSCPSDVCSTETTATDTLKWNKSSYLLGTILHKLDPSVGDRDRNRARGSGGVWAESCDRISRSVHLCVAWSYELRGTRTDDDWYIRSR
jgi:hypothetical protein